VLDGPQSFGVDRYSIGAQGQYREAMFIRSPEMTVLSGMT
jgi:hypothetical protein